YRLPVRRPQNWWPDGPLVFNLISAHCPGLPLSKLVSIPAHLRPRLISIKPNHRDSPLPPFPFALSRKRPHPFLSAWSDCHGGLSRLSPAINPVNQSGEQNRQLGRVFCPRVANSLHLCNQDLLRFLTAGNKVRFL